MRVLLTVLLAFPLFLPGDCLHAATAVKSLSRRAELPGEWKIMIGDDLSYADPGYNDSGWDRIVLPGSFMSYVMEKTGRAHGMLWIRTALDFDARLPRESIGLIMGRIGDADRTYFNGNMIGSLAGFPPGGQFMWNQPRHYLVPEGIIRYGAKNIIAVRISYVALDRVAGTLALTNLEDWNRDRIVQNLMVTAPLYLLIGAGFAYGLIFILFAFKRKNRGEYVMFILQFIPGLYIIMETCNAVQISFDIVMRAKLFGFMWNLLVLVHLMFLHRIYDLKRRKMEIFLIAVFLVNTLIIILIKDISQRQFGLIVLFILTSLALYNISIHLQQFVKGNPYAKLLFILGITLALGAAHDGLAMSPLFLGPTLNFFGYTFQYPIFPYAAMAMFIGAGLIVVYRFLKMTTEVEDLNRNLEVKVEERTRELEKSLNDLSNAIEASFIQQRLKHAKSNEAAISPKTEEKLKQAIIYINNNYCENFSREGLAASLDINPDHLGKAFMKYTGKKISEYINYLRIKQSIKELGTTDRTIIDIAFSLGFESLSTFNRAFIKILKTSPRKFRNKHSIVPYISQE